MIELLVSLVILTIALSIVFLTFTSTIKAWTKGGEMLDDLHHGEFVMEQLVTALRSTAFFQTRPDKYGFRLKRNSGGGRTKATESVG